MTTRTETAPEPPPVNPAALEDVGRRLYSNAFREGMALARMVTRGRGAVVYGEPGEATHYQLVRGPGDRLEEIIIRRAPEPGTAVPVFPAPAGELTPEAIDAYRRIVGAAGVRDGIRAAVDAMADAPILTVASRVRLAYDRHRLVGVTQQDWRP